MSLSGLRRRGRRLLSPLTRRILAINLLAPVLLVAGLLYVDQYRDALVEAQIDALFAQGELMAGALGESAIAPSDVTPEIGTDLSRQIIRRLAATSGTRVRLFDPDGALVADSRQLAGAGRDVLQEFLPPPQPPTMGEQLRDWGGQMLRRLRSGSSLPPYREPLDQHAGDYAEVLLALEGEPGSEISEVGDGSMMISVAVPVQGLRTVVGALLLSVDSTSIDERVREERLNILKLLGLTLIITVLLSLYLARAIARPVRQLAIAATQVRGGGNRRAEIPDFSKRNDEIGELSSALREMTGGLYRRIDAIESFAADVAHELKNPLTSIRSAVETMERAEKPELRARLLAIVQDDVRRMDRLISDISDASRLDAELSRTEARPVDLAALLENLVGAYRDTAGPTAPAFVCDIEQVPLSVAGNQSRLGQVARNLLDNARSFSPPRGAVRVAASRVGADIFFCVEDDGPGIPDEKLATIFERFYTERPAGEAFGTHSGLGLSISKQIVDAYGGTISAENRRDGLGAVIGARFTVRLPALS